MAAPFGQGIRATLTLYAVPPLGEDAVEEPLHQNATADQSATPDEHHFKDPKKTLRGFFEREGLELEYEVEETGPGHARVYHCRVKYVERFNYRTTAYTQRRFPDNTHFHFADYSLHMKQSSLTYGHICSA